MSDAAPIPWILLVEPQAGRHLTTAAFVTTISEGEPALVAFTSRASAAQWRETNNAAWDFLPVRTLESRERLAATALIRLGYRWVALDPGTPAAARMDLYEWLKHRQPWRKPLRAFLETQGWARTFEALYLGP